MNKSYLAGSDIQLNSIINYACSPGCFQTQKTDTHFSGVKGPRKFDFAKKETLGSPFAKNIKYRKSEKVKISQFSHFKEFHKYGK